MTRNHRGKSKSRSKKGRKASDFAYLMQRKGLRMMRRYYKEKFENSGLFQNYKQEIRSLTYEEIDNLIRKFITQEFPDVLDYQRYGEYTRLEDSCKTLILGDRYNKNETITDGLDFDGVRKVLYHFNTRNLINFLSTNGNSFLFYHYFDGIGEKDAKSQTDVDPETLYKEMQELYKESEKYLKITMDNFKRDGYTPAIQEYPIFDYNEDEEMQFI